MSLEDTEKELYGRASSSARDNRLSARANESSPAPSSSQWSDELYYSHEGMISDAPLTFFEKYGKWIIGSLVGVLLLLTGVAGFYIYQYFTTKDATLSVDAPSRVMEGVPFTVSVSFMNTSKKNLVSPHLSLSLPDGAYATADDSKRVVDIAVPDTAAGESVKRDFRVIVVGQPLTTYSFTAVASYQYDAGSLSGTFKKEAVVSVAVGDPAIGINFSAPDKVLSGQDFEVDFSYKNNSDISFSNVSFVLSLPANFTLSNSSPTLNGSSVVVQQLNPGESGTIVFSGTLAGVAGSYASIGAAVNILVDGRTYALQNNSATIAINASPLALTITASSQSGAVTASGTPVAYPGQRINYVLTFTNNSSVTFHDIILEARLTGVILDTSNIRIDNGYFDSTSNTVRWTGSTVPALVSLSPGASGSVSFGVSTLNDYPIHQLSDKNFTVKMDATITSPTVPENVVAASTVGEASMTVLIGGALSFGQQIYAHEPSAVGIKNIGPIPPRVGSVTQYTVHWILATRGTDFANTVVTATLGPGVIWTGAVSANVSSTPSYNDRTQQIVWNVGSLLGGTGVITNAPQAVFQVAVTPQPYMVNNPITLVNGAAVASHDQFINQDISQTVRAVGSRDISDADLPQNYDRVVP